MLEQNSKAGCHAGSLRRDALHLCPCAGCHGPDAGAGTQNAARPDDTELLARHDQLQNIVDAADGYNMDVNIKKVLSGMGFAQDTWQKNIAVLSGGELTRLRLAKLLLEKPDVLILDEPTNHLDFATMEWLENYLKSYSGAVLVVSHDRYFLDNVCTKIWESPTRP